MSRAALGWIVQGVFILFLLLPVFALLALSFTSGTDFIANPSLLPSQATFANYQAVLSSPAWGGAFGNAFLQSLLSAFVAVAVSLPAAYAFSRYRFFGDRHVFFWLLAARMAPLAVLLGPLAGLYAAIGFGQSPAAVALAHCIVNAPVAIWIVEGAMSRISIEIDETADIDGYSFPAFFFRIMLPQIWGAAGVAGFFCFMFSWTETLIAGAVSGETARAVTPRIMEGVMTQGSDWGVLAAAGALTILPGAALVWLVRNRLAGGIAMGRV
jgi:glycerol transport system permease protein